MRNISEELRFDSLNKISSLIEQTEITIEYFESMNSPIEHINASEAEILITDLVRETNVSLSNLGFDSNLMENFFGSNDDPRIALVGLGLISGLKVDASPNALICLGSAVGADLFIALGEAIVSYVGSGSASALTAETLFSIGVGGLKKVLRNFLGPIGIAVAAYSFVDCMEWI
ncbi:hypothetical protein BFP78_03350 [Gaetbulibacter sp. 5U11]|nr:hypothetical protein BFP78_03350 [Gaetbulibacter sp. 5U11]